MTEEIKAFDFLGNELKVGDKVVYTELHYRNFKTGIITKITKFCVFIDKTDKWSGVRQDHKQVIKI